MNYPHAMTAEQMVAAAKTDPAVKSTVLKVFRSGAVLVAIDVPGRGVSKVKIPAACL